MISAPECDDRDGDLAASQCWDAAGAVADVELNKTWPRLMELVRRNDKGFNISPRKGRASATADLLASQRAWLKLRDTQCALEGDYAQGGSLEPVIYGRCYTVMTRERIKQLKDIVEGFQEP